MNMTLVIILLVAIFSIFFYSACFLIVRKSNNEKYIREHSISFKESMDLINVPIITFKVEDRSVNFLLDTGSNISYISDIIIKDLGGLGITNKCSENLSVQGISGATNVSDRVDLRLDHNNQTLIGRFFVIDFTDIKNSVNLPGIEIGGILGSNFFNAYKYTIDFRKLVAYNNTRK